MFLVGSFIAGWGAGMLACVVPMYQAEVSMPETRGTMVCVTGIAYAFGYTLAGWLGARRLEPCPRPRGVFLYPEAILA
jgi:MFS family permease